MNALFLTVFIGLVLVSLALAFFAFTRKSSNWSSPERDSLMPLHEERTVAHRSRD